MKSITYLKISTPYSFKFSAANLKTAAQPQGKKFKPKGVKILEKKTIGMTAKDLINAQTSSIPLKQVSGEVITATGLCVDYDTENERTISYIVTNDGVVYGSISETVSKAISRIIDYMNASHETPVALSIEMRKATSGREFITVRII